MMFFGGLFAITFVYLASLIMIRVVNLLKRGILMERLGDIYGGSVGLLRFIYDVEKPKLHGGDIVASVLKVFQGFVANSKVCNLYQFRAHDVNCLFTLCGGHISPILVGCQKVNIKVVDTRHECTAVFAADAVARLTGNVGVACVTAGPGLTNTVTAVMNAKMAESSVLLIGGATSALLKGRGSLQDIDQVGLMKTVCKRVYTVKSVQKLADVLKRAICSARSGVPGPVFVEIPLDVLHPFEVVESELKHRTTSKSLFNYLMNFYLELYLCRLFSGGWQNFNPRPLPISYPSASDSKVSRCYNLLKHSRRPIILLGSQAVTRPKMCETLIQSLRALGVPCFCNGMARGLLNSTPNLHIMQNRRQALKEADLIILAGAVCDFRLDYGRNLNPRAKVVCINRERAQLRLNAGVFWKAVVSARGDPCDFIVRLSKLANDTLTDRFDEWIAELKQRDKVKEAEISELAEQIPDDQGTVNPLKLLQIVRKCLPKDTVLVVDGGDFVGSAAYILNARGPLSWLDPGVFGTLGVGAGFAIGAKMCNPHRPVWIIFGDGAFGYSVAEIDTMIRHNIAAVMLIGNDGGWAQICRTQVKLFDSDVGCKLQQTAYEEVARGFGAAGCLVNADNIDELEKQLANATTSSSAFVINAFIGRTSFRDGSISV